MKQIEKNNRAAGAGLQWRLHQWRVQRLWGALALWSGLGRPLALVPVFSWRVRVLARVGWAFSSVGFRVFWLSELRRAGFGSQALWLRRAQPFPWQWARAFADRSLCFPATGGRPFRPPR